MEQLAERNGGSLVGARFGCLVSASRFTAPIASAAAESVGEGTDDGWGSCEAGGVRGGGGGGRQLADLVVHRTACMARVVEFEKSLRPVTGAPRLGIRLICEEVRLRGLDCRYIDAKLSACSARPSALVDLAKGHSACAAQTRHRSPSPRALYPQAFDVDPSTLSPTEGGFLIGKAAAGSTGTADVSMGGGGEVATTEEVGTPTKVVCVVGLAHANGVLERCAERDLCA